VRGWGREWVGVEEGWVCKGDDISSIESMLCAWVDQRAWMDQLEH
jgi:hypothetical protein